MVDLELKVLSDCLPLTNWQSICLYLSHKDLLPLLEQLQISLDVADIESADCRHWFVGLHLEVKPRLMAMSVAVILKIEVVFVRTYLRCKLEVG